MEIRSKNLLLVEDDPFLVEWALRLCHDRFPEVAVITVSVESEFVRRMPEFVSLNLFAIILDAIIPWSDDSAFDPNSAPAGEYFSAGLRILDELAKTPRLASVPVLFHSCSEPEDFDHLKSRHPMVAFFRKDGPDFMLSQWISMALNRSRLSQR